MIQITKVATETPKTPRNTIVNSVPLRSTFEIISINQGW